MNSLEFGDPRWCQIPFGLCITMCWAASMATFIISILGPLSGPNGSTRPDAYAAGVTLMVISGISVGIDVVFTILYLFKLLSPLAVIVSMSPLTIAWLALLGYYAGLAGTPGIDWGRPTLHVVGLVFAAISFITTLCFAVLSIVTSIRERRSNLLMDAASEVYAEPVEHASRPPSYCVRFGNKPEERNTQDMYKTMTTKTYVM